ncbi:MAG: histidinol dehydrogenase [Syntrophus sp. (in: bacteria)]|nr:histidinol dehydrogenase [Syntrophus sp. (in: bacteria)]
MRIIATGDSLFEETFQRIAGRGRIFDGRIWQTVKDIVDDVARRGDAALFAYAKQLDQTDIDAGSVEVSASEWDEAERVSRKDLSVLQLACRRIESYHRRQAIPSWSYTEEDGVELGQRVSPLEKIGIYAPGGLAAYPSTVLMAAIPARIAGVKEILLVTPVKGGILNPLIAAAARLSGVTRIFKIGGAHAIAALAYGTESVPRVDKIVGPGNAYVTTAKRMVYGVVDIDMIAGPSEVLIIADGTADASFIAADLLAQAEHDEMASAILLTPDGELARQVAAEVDAQLAALPKQAVACRSLDAYGAVMLTRNLDEAVALANRFAPEHLELMVAKPQTLLADIRHAGAVFLGGFTPEALGDYLAGPNHILPTGGTARFSSPLGVYDFLKRTSILSFSAAALNRYRAQAEHFARIEGLDGHARSLAVRRKIKKP